LNEFQLKVDTAHSDPNSDKIKKSLVQKADERKRRREEKKAAYLNAIAEKKIEQEKQREAKSSVPGKNPDDLTIDLLGFQDPLPEKRAARNRRVEVYKDTDFDENTGERLPMLEAIAKRIEVMACAAYYHPLKGASEKLVACNDCGDIAHGECTKLTEAQISNFYEYEWFCDLCGSEVCSVCSKHIALRRATQCTRCKSHAHFNCLLGWMRYGREVLCNTCQAGRGSGSAAETKTLKSASNNNYDGDYMADDDIEEGNYLEDNREGGIDESHKGEGDEGDGESDRIEESESDKSDADDDLAGFIAPDDDSSDSDADYEDQYVLANEDDDSDDDRERRGEITQGLAEDEDIEARFERNFMTQEDYEDFINEEQPNDAERELQLLLTFPVGKKWMLEDLDNLHLHFRVALQLLFNAMNGRNTMVNSSSIHIPYTHLPARKEKEQIKKHELNTKGIAKLKRLLGHHTAPAAS